MANELGIVDVSGLTYSCEIFSGQTLIATVSPLTEVVDGNSSRYYGDFPSGSATANTSYTFFYIQDSTIEGAEEKRWDGSKLLGPEDFITATGFSTHDAASVWSVGTRTLTGFGTLIADIWSYTTRTLTNVQNNTVSSNVGNRLTITRGITFTDTFSGLTIPANWSKMTFTAKDCPDDQVDSESTLQIEESSPASGEDGLQYLNGTGSTLVATLTTTQGSGTVDINISDEATRLLPVDKQIYYDLKVDLNDGTNQLLVRDGLLEIISTSSRGA